MRHTNQLTQTALDQAARNSAESSAQFQVQLHRFDASLGHQEVLGMQAATQTEQTTKLADAASKQASVARISAKTGQASLQATIDIFRREQRAWIDASPAVGAPKSSGPFDIKIPFQNTGRTPAINVDIFFKASFSVNRNFDFVKIVGHQPLGNMAPGATFEFHYGSSPGSEQIVLANTGRPFYVYGTVTYKDVFRQPHWLTFCFMNIKQQETYAYCGRHSDLGDGPVPDDVWLK